ncbi:MAG TPA: DUF4956 domain-containing protein [Gemmatimonadales bacterium]|nr:DUF4956 domain-containing protein [Gemmatimonadales bacterium]
MDEFIQQTMSRGTTGDLFGIWEVMAALALSLVLSLMVAYFYRQTHRGLSYSVSFVHAMIIMGVTVSVIMLIIGSNIARAFTLVGALSIIRFRNAVKDSRDVAFIFLTMAIGMATGTGFYLTAIVFTLFACGMVYLLSRFEVGASTTREVLLKVHLPEYLDYHTVFNDVFYRYLQDHSLLSVETIRDGTVVELVYSIEFKRGADEGRFLEELRGVVGEHKVALLAGQENINV